MLLAAAAVARTTMRGRPSSRSSRTRWSLKHDHRQDQPARFDAAPVSCQLARDRIARRRRHDLEVLGAVGIGQDEEDVAAFLQIILQAGLARPDQLGVGERIAGARSGDTSEVS